MKEDDRIMLRLCRNGLFMCDVICSRIEWVDRMQCGAVLSVVGRQRPRWLPQLNRST